jgi:thymidylate synthase
MVWPPFFAQNLTIGSAASGLGICLLWTPQDRIVPALHRDDYAVLGNLYSRDGVNFLLRNVLAQPMLHTLLLCGKDMTGSGAALVALMAHGVDEQHRVIGEGTRIQREIPREAIELFRQNVRLYDARETMRPEQIATLVSELRGPARPFAPEPLCFPYEEPTVEALPATETGFLLRAPTIRSAYLKLLWQAMTFGQRSATQHSSDQRELLDVLTIVADEPTDPARFSHAEWMPFRRDTLGFRQEDGSYSGYLGQFLQADLNAGVSYTYGSRMRAFPVEGGGVDQVAALVGDLQKAPESRRAVIVLWSPLKDPHSPNPPCLTQVQARLRDGSLLLTAYFRSHDIYRAWAINAFGLRALQAQIAAQLRVEAGDLAIHSHSAHIYSHDWEATQELLAHQYRSADPRLQRDPYGSFVIAVEPPEIVVRHYTPDGEHLQSFRSAEIGELMRQLTPFVGLTSHAIYLGSELQKAAVALRLERPAMYRQDRELHF